MSTAEDGPGVPLRRRARRRDRRAGGGSPGSTPRGSSAARRSTPSAADRADRGPPPGDRRRGRRRLGRLLPAAAPVLLPARPDRQPRRPSGTAADHRGLDDRLGFGIRQSETGGGNFVPWFNAPPGTEQRLGVFYLLSRGPAEDALREALRYTHGDRFPELPGYKTFTSHWHMAITVAAMKEKAAGQAATDARLRRDVQGAWASTSSTSPSSTATATRNDPGPVRLAEMEAMFDECRRLSDDELLLIPGEEANVYLGPREPGRHPGHWLDLFPRPVFWTMKRAPGQPFVEDDPKYGTVYHVGDRDDMVRLLEARARPGLDGPPADQGVELGARRLPGRGLLQGRPTGSAPRGRRCPPTSRARGSATASLDLLDDMANWGQRKYLLGEVDVFKIDHTHELYGHMNVNYLQLDRRPPVRRGLAADARRPPRRPVLRDDRRGPAPRRSRSAARRAARPLPRPGDRPEVRARPRLDLPAPVRRGRLRRRREGLPRADRPVRHRRRSAGGR